METDWWKDETKIRLRKVIELHSGKISLTSVRRWCSQKKNGGVQSKSGVRVRLESWKEGGERFTTVEAYRRFVQRQNE